MQTRRILPILALAALAAGLGACKQPQPAAPAETPAAEAPVTPATATPGPASSAKNVPPTASATESGVRSAFGEE